MCTDPQVFNGYEVSCGECDQCVATYKNTWVARCVAEKSTLPHAYAITLTYADVDGEAPLGAKVFRYKDVEKMWKRIRSAGKRKWKENIQLRYVIVGEKGTRFGRCHYHGVIFSDRPIHELGKISHPKGNDFAYRRRLDWSIWGHGYVEFQVPDRKGMAYVLKYILKSRMSVERSRGKGREGKTEWLASSYLWCSKRPAIGHTWLWKEVKERLALGLCPSSLRIRTPGGGDWYISGDLQEELCVVLHFANAEFRADKGRDLAGWKALLESVSDEIEMLDTGEIINRKPWEILVNGKIEEEETEYPEGYFAAKAAKEDECFRNKLQQAERFHSARATVRKCGDILPCEICANQLSQDQRNDLRQEYLLRREEWSEKVDKDRFGEGHAERFEKWWRTRLRPSRGCQLRETDELKEHFQRLVGVEKITPGNTHKKAIGKTL